MNKEFNELKAGEVDYYFLKDEDYEGLVKYKEEKFKKDPNNRYNIIDLGEAYVFNKEYAKAVEFFTEHYKKISSNIDAQYYFLDALYAIGKTETDFKWVEKPRVIQIEEAIEIGYEQIKDKIKYTSIEDLYIDITLLGYLPFESEEMHKHILRDERFEVITEEYDIKLKVKNMKINTILFDLDGTLLPLDVDKFLEIYFGKMGEFLVKKGMNPKPIISSIWTGTKIMLKNDGTLTNEDLFWKSFDESYSNENHNLKEIIKEYYETDFQVAKESSSVHHNALECVSLLLDKGYEVILSTNPVFPEIATHSRIKWAGLKPELFSYITTYENSSYCKPNKEYFNEILNKINKIPSECIIIGNDADEDMVAHDMGMEAFLVTDCLINKSDKDISKYNNGDFQDLYDYIKKLPKIN